MLLYEERKCLNCLLQKNEEKNGKERIENIIVWMNSFDIKSSKTLTKIAKCDNWSSYEKIKGETLLSAW